MSVDPKTSLDEVREALAEYDALPEADNLDTMLDNASRIIRLQEHAPDYIRAALAEVDRLTTEFAEARRQLDEERARVAPVADTGDCRTCKWADTVVCHNPEGKRKNSPVWTWCAHALAEDLVTRLGTSPPCPGYTKK